MSERNEVVMARQPIVNRQERLSGYELLFRSRSGPTSGDRMSLSVIAEACLSVGLSDTLGGQPGYLNLTRDLLFGDAIEVLPPHRFVLEILETVDADQDLAVRCRELRKLGFLVALDDYVVEDPRADLLGEVDLVKVDLPFVGVNDLGPLVSELKTHPVRLLAEKVETREEFETCLGLGFDLFQGFYFARPESIQGKRSQSDSAELVRTLRLVESGAETEELAAVIKSQPLIAIKLLCLVNSAVAGLTQAISSISQAITYLGRRELRRWLWILLFSGADQRGMRSPQLWLAAVRGRALELAAEQMPASVARAVDPGTAFTIGLLSVGHALLGRSLEQLVSALNLGPPADEALLSRSGPFGEVLAALEQLDDGSVERAQQHAAAAGFDLSELSRFAAEGNLWVGQILDGLDP